MNESKSAISVVRLMGGLGNQMFQYAFGKALAEKSGQNIGYDPRSGFLSDAYGRKVGLWSFNTTAVLAKSEAIPLGMTWRSPFHRVAKMLWLIRAKFRPRVVYERKMFDYDEKLIIPTDHCLYYFGYWQNEKYFDSIAKTLKKEFTLRSPFRKDLISLVNMIENTHAISLHIRHKLGISAGGTVIRKARRYHGECSPDYYKRSLQFVPLTANSVLYIFADDVEWAKHNIQLSARAQYVADICQLSDEEEMMLMSRCHHHVIANSTFSWWGAWLGHNANKVVVAPRSWLAQDSEESLGIYPRSWIRV